MTAIRNIFACAVHESPECITDLVRNLNYLDPASTILLYNGSKNPRLLEGLFPYERYGVVAHPQPRPLTWGQLHPFALNCMQFALDHLSFETITMVDSDQLAARPGYSRYLAQFLADQQGVGVVGNSTEPQPASSQIGPVAAAFKEIELWRPFLRRFPEGEKSFVYRLSWACTVFTVEAARDLTQLIATDAQLQAILSRTKIWVTEEVILPTLVALLGYNIVVNPCSYDYVKFRTPYTIQQIDEALNRPDVFWVHPVARRYEDKVRQYIRTRFNHYEPITQSLV